MGPSVATGLWLCHWEGLWQGSELRKIFTCLRTSSPKIYLSERFHTCPQVYRQDIGLIIRSDFMALVPWTSVVANLDLKSRRSRESWESPGTDHAVTQLNWRCRWDTVRHRFEREYSYKWTWRGFGIPYGPGEKWLGSCTSAVSTQVAGES